jgi:hypothetical protein
MEFGFFFWPYDPDLVRRMANAADRYGFDLIGIADTPSNSMDPWVAATMVADATERPRLASALATWSRNIRRFPPQRSPHLIFWLQIAQSSALVLGIAEREISDSRGRGLPSLPPVPHSYANCSEVGPRYGRARRHIYHGCTGAARSLSPALARRLSLAAGNLADGAFVNFGIAAENLAQTEAAVIAGARAAGRLAKPRTENCATSIRGSKGSRRTIRLRSAQSPRPLRCGMLLPCLSQRDA